MKKILFTFAASLFALGLTAQDSKLTVVKSTRTVDADGNTLEEVDYQYNEYGDETISTTTVYFTDSYPGYGDEEGGYMPFTRSYTDGKITTQNRIIYDGNRNPIRYESYELTNGDWEFNGLTENSNFDGQHRPHNSIGYELNPETGEWEKTSLIVIERYTDIDQCILESIEYVWVKEKNDWQQASTTTGKTDDAGHRIGSTMVASMDMGGMTYSITTDTKYEYYTDPVRYKSVTMEMKMMGMVVSSTVSTYDYEFDEQGRISAMIQNRDGEPFHTIYYTYEEIDVRDSDGVRDIQADMADAPLYNIQGQRIQQPAKGLYIQGGRKIVK